MMVLVDSIQHLLNPFRMSQRVRLREIAQATGYAKSTVSMALREDHTIPEATRRLIQESAKRLGYRPDPLLASFASKRFRAVTALQGTAVALLVHENWNEVHRGREVTASTLEFGLKHAGPLGYALREVRLRTGADAARVGRQLHHQGVQGVVLPRFARLVDVPGFPWENFSCVAQGQGTGDWQPGGRSPDRVAADPLQTVRIAHAIVRSQGYRRIGFVLYYHEPRLIDDDLREAGLWLCQKNTPAGEWVSPRLHPFEAELTDIGEWVREERLDAVIGHHGGVLWRLEADGLRIPEDLGYFQLEADWPGEWRIAPIAGLEYLLENETRAALERLDQLIRYRHRGLSDSPQLTLLCPRWIPGRSLPPAPAGRDRSVPDTRAWRVGSA